MHLSKTFLGLLALGGVLLLSSSALSHPQDTGKGGKRGGQGTPRAEDPAKRGERFEAFRQAFAENKTSLAEAIILAEAEKKGKAFSAQMRLGKDGKLKIPVELIVEDKVLEVIVDPETKKVITPLKGERPEGPEAGGAPEGKEGGG